MELDVLRLRKGVPWVFGMTAGTRVFARSPYCFTNFQVPCSYSKTAIITSRNLKWESTIFSESLNSMHVTFFSLVSVQIVN